MRKLVLVVKLVVLVLVMIPGCSFIPTLNSPVTQPNQIYVVPNQALTYLQSGQVWLAETDGSNAQRVSLATAHTYHPIWVPQTDTLLYGIVNEPYFELWSHNLTTGELRLLTAGRIIQQQLHVAPNGQYLTYIAGTELYLLDLTDGTTKRLDEETTDASWSPDSRNILFSTSDGRLLQTQFRATGELDPAEVLLTQSVAWLSWTDKHTIQFVTTHDDVVTLDQYDIKTGLQHTLLTLSNTTLSDIAQLTVIDTSTVLVLLVDGTLNQFQIDEPKLLASDVTEYSLAPAGDLLYYTQANVVTLFNLKTNTTSTLALTNVTELQSR